MSGTLQNLALFLAGDAGVEISATLSLRATMASSASVTVEMAAALSPRATLAADVNLHLLQQITATLGAATSMAPTVTVLEVVQITAALGATTTTAAAVTLTVPIFATIGARVEIDGRIMGPLRDELYLFATSPLDLSCEATGYITVEMDEGNPEIEREMRSGCGMQKPRLVRRQLSSIPIPIRVHCVGSTASAAYSNYGALIGALEGAVAYQLGDTEHANYVNAPTYLVRRVDDEDPPRVYTVLDYDNRRVRKDLDGLTGHQTVTVDLELACYPGQVLSS